MGTEEIVEPVKTTYTLEFPPWYQVQTGKLSRKRFVKLQMGRGASRNKANSLARSWREKTRGAPYYLEAFAHCHGWVYKIRLGNCRIK